MKPFLSTFCCLLGFSLFAGSSTIVFHSSTPDSGVGVVLSTEVTNASVTVNPSSTTVLTNSDAEFSATASGNLLSYYWITNSVLALDGNDVSGAFTTSLVLSNVVIGQSNMPVAFIVSNYCGVVTSTVAVLTVTNSPGGGGGTDNSTIANFWKMDDSFPATGGLVDSIDGGNLFTNSSDGVGFGSVAGVVGNAVNFTASHTCSAQTNVVAAPANNAWTFWGWFKLTSIEALGTVVGVGNLSSQRQVLVREQSSDNTLHIWLSAAGAGDAYNITTNTTATLSTGTWYEFFAAHDPSGGGTLWFYLFDTSGPLSTNILTTGALFAGTDKSCSVGGNLGLGSAGSDFNGAIDGLGYATNSAWDYTRILYEWNNGAGRTHP